MKPDHVAVLKTFSLERRRSLLARRNGPGLFRLTIHWGLIVVLGFCIAWQVPHWPVLLLPQGLLIISLFSLLHETIHKSPFRSGWLNTTAARVSGFMLFLPPLWFRHFHTAHHRYTNEPERDPELAEPRPRTWSQYLWYLSGIPVWISHGKVLLINGLGKNRDTYVPERDRAAIQRESRVLIALYGLLITASLYGERLDVFWAWIVPAIVAQPFLRAYLLAEHGGCAFVENMFENTRTTFTTRLVRFFMWNMPYHTEHHIFPAVPFHRLPELHRMIRDHLRVTSDGYIDFHKSFSKQLMR